MKKQQPSYSNLFDKEGLKGLKRRIEEVFRRISSDDEIYKLKEKFQRGVMKQEMGEDMIRAVGVELIKRKEWNAPNKRKDDE